MADRKYPTQEELKEIQLCLLLVLDKKVPLKVIRGWTSAERLLATEWASASYLRASDNNLRVPPIPVSLRAFLRGGGTE